MDTTRQEPPVEGPSEQMLVAFVDFHRATLARKCDGLTTQQAATRSVPPSDMSLLGLVRHMTDVEKMWFVWRLRGDEPLALYRTAENPNAAFNDLDGADLEQSIERWQAACERSREIVAEASSFDEMSIGTRRENQHVSLRWILMHFIEEYARHNGHADLLRQAIDGAVGV